ncbi:hypothetical protein ABZ942_35055 [Nocardia sp. NPDC046473]|uniref:hypothetical protein n=1 Tax=Nocardia sp. NPDC046473 TaxID=3155733 RepID=UPI0033C685D7
MPLDKIALSMRGNEVWIRNSSYPDMLEATVSALFDPPQIRERLRRSIGFTAAEALAVLSTCHELQVQGWNARLEANAAVAEEILAERADPTELDGADPKLERFRRTWLDAWQGRGHTVSVHPTAIAASTGLDVETILAVAQHFRLNLDGRTPHQLVLAFSGGDNPLRTNPLLVSADGELMLVHSSFIQSAIRENLEQHLKSDPSAWDEYQQHRGRLLEHLAADAFQTLLPGAQVYASFEYFVPDNDGQAAGEPSDYTKKVEGDLLFLLDDVAVIVEAKAVAVNPRSRAGDTRRLRRDLIKIIKDAADQASRLAERIECDTGIRLHKDGWLDLSHIREIHMVALSLEDLAGISTATADLLSAGLLDATRIPWTVSIHDLQLISELIDTPAEFLLYLRRRTDPETTMVYMAPDELDLFLYFYEKGLYVEPDPQQTQLELPFMKPTTGATRRRRALRRSFITSRTDPLDRWHYSRHDPHSPAAPKPVLNNSPIAHFVASLHDRGDYGWLSVGATLLSGSTKSQDYQSRIAKQLLDQPDPLGRERSMTVPIGSTKKNAWVMVWMTRPRSRSLEQATNHLTSYLRVKKYQWGLNRGVGFLFDQHDRALSAVVYNGDRLSPDPELDEQVTQLYPADYLPSRPPPKAKRRR